MRVLQRSPPSPALVLAVVALGLATVGSAVAGTDGLTSKITKSKVKSIAKQQIDKAAPGLSVAKAENATSLGGVPAGGYTQSGCNSATGAIKGSVRINAATTTGVLSAAGVQNAYNCSGGAVEVRRISTGKYEVVFSGNPSLVAVATPLEADGTDSWSINSASINRVGAGDFKVQIFNHGLAAFIDRSFSLLLL
jgi:hypothetical protein